MKISDFPANINNPNSVGSAQEYLVSLYMDKMNLFVGDIHMNPVSHWGGHFEIDLHVTLLNIRRTHVW